MRVPAAQVHIPERDRAMLLKQFEEIMTSGQLTLGRYTKLFEEAFAERVGVKHAVAVNSGTSALEIVLRALDIGESNVIVPTNTFAATAFAVLHAGARLVLADVAQNLCMDAESLENTLDPKTKAVILVHIGGLIPQQVKTIREICDDRRLFLLEDAAHAHGSQLEGLEAGNFGVAAAYSFYPTKVMTSGEGGMIVTNDSHIGTRALVLRDQGKAAFSSNLHTELGYNWRMSEFHAALGLSQLGRLDEFIKNRRRVGAVYDAELTDANIRPLQRPAGSRTNYYKYVAFLAEHIDRTELKQHLKERHEISLSGEVYETPLHLQPIFRGVTGQRTQAFPMAESLCKRHICLPVSAVTSDDTARYVASALKRETR